MQSSQESHHSHHPSMIDNNKDWGYDLGASPPSITQSPNHPSSSITPGPFVQPIRLEEDDVTANCLDPRSTLINDMSDPSLIDTLNDLSDTHISPEALADLPEHPLSPFSQPTLDPKSPPLMDSVNPANLVHSRSSSTSNLLSITNPHDSQTLQLGSSQHLSPHHSRRTSFDPSASAFGSAASWTHDQQPSDWTTMLQGPQFQGHRRAPSEQSDISSQHTHSPFVSYLDNTDIFDHGESPFLPASSDAQLFDDSLGIQNFNLSDPLLQSSSTHQSPFISPQIIPEINSERKLHADTTDIPSIALDIPAFTSTSIKDDADTMEAFPSMVATEHPSLPVNEYGQADQYDVPQISVQPAPTLRQTQPEATHSLTDLDALIPPGRGRQTGRSRAKSDTHISRSILPILQVPGSLDSTHKQSHRRVHSLSPYDFTSASNSGSGLDRRGSCASSCSSGSFSSSSRSGSGGVATGSRSGSGSGTIHHNRRLSSCSMSSHRDYLLDLADPGRPSAAGGDKRVQKHPATFACHLCSKRFTRAYNLRSHLRTHTDERPFECTVCGKAFARQHDRKRHESLHSGEKKYECYGTLTSGVDWGCRRRFARADALGRHFRSEAGRECIKPLVDEEALERRSNLRQPNSEFGVNGNNQIIDPSSDPSSNTESTMGTTNTASDPPREFQLPAILLQQFPALQNIQWDQLANSNNIEDDDLLSASDVSPADSVWPP